MFRVVPSPIIRSQTTVSTESGICHTVTATCRHHGRVGTALLSSMRWNSSSNSSTIAAGSSIGLTIPDAVCTVCDLDDGRKNRLKHAEQFIEINRSGKRCILLVVL